jgi:hypothetical protein
MRIGKQDQARTAIATSDADSITVRGHDLCNELIGKINFTDYFWLLVLGESPSPVQRAMLDACLVAIAEHGLVPSVSVEDSLFAGSRVRDGLSDTLDRITRRFGYDAVYAGSMHEAKKAAPRRIAFGNIPDLRIPDAERCDRAGGGG